MFRGKRGGLIAFVVIAGLVTGGLGWATAAALRLEGEQAETRARDDLYAKLRLALWRLDSFMVPELAREASRPFNHYDAIFIPIPAFDNAGKAWAPGAVLELSPLVNAELPEWMELHFTVTKEGESWSPQVLSDTLRRDLRAVTKLLPAQPKQVQVLKEVAKNINPETLLFCVGQQENRLESMAPLPPGEAGPGMAQRVESQAGREVKLQNAGAGAGPPQSSLADFQNRASRSTAPYNLPEKAGKDVKAGAQVANTIVQFGNQGPNNENLLTPGLIAKKGKTETVTLGPMAGVWVDAADGTARLLIARRVNVGAQEMCQAIALNWEALQTLLLAEVADLFPEGRLLPMREDTPSHPERTMTALPVELDPGPSALQVAAVGWTPLRIGLALAWAAALLALGAVALGGWSLIDLSQRRIRFVSTVTHELRTPLTTLRLYLDMLTGGLVPDEKKKEEYLHTLHSETERLNRLVGNVLDFSRLENQTPRLDKTTVAVNELLDQVRTQWQTRCQDCDKELIVENQAGDVRLTTDVNLVQQILGNLIDNARKYSRSAQDKRLWVRASAVSGRIRFEVEDRGPGIASGEKRSIFRPFRRGRDADVIAGGVGLGLALAHRWASLLGGTLTVQSCQSGNGACFRLELPG